MMTGTKPHPPPAPKAPRTVPLPLGLSTAALWLTGGLFIGFQLHTQSGGQPQPWWPMLALWAGLGLLAAAAAVTARRSARVPRSGTNKEEQQSLVVSTDATDYVALLSGAQEGVAVLQNLRPVFCNASFAYMLGATPDQMVRSDITEFIYAGDRELFETAAERQADAAETTVSRFLVRFVTLPGDLRRQACALRPGTWRGEAALLLYALDVTDLQKETREKEKVRDRFHAMMACSLSGLAVFDAFGSLQEANDNWYALWAPQGKSGAHVNVLYGDLSFPAPLAQAFTEAFNGEETLIPGLEYMASGGKMRQLRIGLHPFADATGKMDGVLMIQDDITESVRSAQAELDYATRSAQARFELLRTRDHFAAVMDATPSAMIGIDESMRVTFWNSMAEQRFDISRRQVLSQDLLSVCRPLAKHEAMIQNTLRAKVFSQANLVPYMENGLTEYEDISVYPIETNLETGAIIRLDNVTRRMRLENDLAQADRFSAVGMLASGMAHEINNPLSAIMQGVQNIDRRLLAELPVNAAAAMVHGTTLSAVQGYVNERQVPDLLRQMRESGDRIARIVSNMLHFSRQRDMVRAPIKAVTLVREALDFAKSDREIREMIDFSQIAVHFEPSAALPRVTCSETEIVQVLLQLLRTSVYSMTQRAGAAIPDPAIRIEVSDDEEFLSIFIRNNGPDLPPEVCKRIFEPFYTTHGMRQGGNGIGLSLAFFIVTTVHKGSLLCESSPGQGTVFTVRLPLTAA